MQGLLREGMYVHMLMQSLTYTLPHSISLDFSVTESYDILF